MVKGLKQTSSVVAISFGVTESAPNVFTQGSVDLNLSPLDREVFVVLAINMDLSGGPNGIAATDTATQAALTTTSQATIANLSESNCLGVAFDRISSAGYVDNGVALQQSIETPPATLEFIGVIATNDFFVGIQGANNTSLSTVTGKMYGYRAVADASIFAALVQSEVLSA